MSNEKINGKLNQLAWILPVMVSIIISLFALIFNSKTAVVEDNSNRLRIMEPKVSVLETRVENNTENIKNINDGIKVIQTDVKTLLQRP